MEDIIRFVIIKGFIDGRDDKMVGSYGVFLAVASSEEVKYLSAHFSPVPIDRQLGYAALLSLIHSEGEDQPDEDEDAPDTPLHSKIGLERFIIENRLLQASVKNMNNKTIEQRVNQFCAESLHLRSVTFVSIEAASDADLALFTADQETEEAPERQENGESAPGAGDGETSDSGEAGEGDGKETSVYVALEPVLDPVSGVAAGELAAGDSVVCRLPEDSVYYNLFKNSSPGFEGTMAGEISEIKINEYGTAVVGVHLAEGVSGVLKLSGSVRIRLTDKESYQRKHSDLQQPWGDGKSIPLGIVLCALGVFLLLCIVGVLLFSLS